MVFRPPWVIAHRGASGHAPENTLAAFRRAVELGAGFIETDLHLTRDARFAVIHDDTLERTTNGRGRVRDYTLAELRELDAGSWFDPKFAGEPIPALDDVLSFARDADVVLYLEIKFAGAFGAHHGLVGALRTNEQVDRAVVISFDAGTLGSVRRLDATIMTGLLFDRPNPEMVKLAEELGARQLAPRGDLLTVELVERAHAADLKVATWTLNEASHMRLGIAAGVDGIMTDYPDRLRAVLDDLEVQRQFERPRG
jgi:glycerophosphoryl diester phosphodiesterase